MDRQKQYFSVPKRTKNTELLSSRLFIVPHQRLDGLKFSIGKSSKNINYNHKIAIIKNTCMNQIANDHGNKNRNYGEKNYSLANQDQQDTSCIMSEEDDNAELEEQSLQGSVLLQSKFNNRPSTILFRYPNCCEKQHNQRSLRQAHRLIKTTLINPTYRIYGSEYKCIVNAFEFNGFKKAQNSRDWHVFFDVRGSKIKITYNKITEDQKFNHFAGCWHLGRKDQLWKGGYRQRKLFPQDYNFLPRTFIFPADYNRFENVRQMSEKNQLWIQKPVASSKGRNIKVITNQARVSNKRNYLVSQYINNPHLINNLKYDLRIYVLVTSFNPLKIYVYENGLARFATEQYRTKGKKNKFIHLTNFSVNKYSKNFVQNKKSQNPQDQHVSKWSLFKLKQHYTKIGVDYNHVFKQVEDIVIKTCISAEASMLAPKYRYEDKRTVGFQLYGFDILIDSKLKAWLMEVNVCPSLCSSSLFDKKIKHTLIVDLLNLVGINPPAPQRQKSQAQSPKLNKQEFKKYKFKNPNSIINLGFQNCLELLAPQDWHIIFQNQEELDRMSLGQFKRAFPRKDNILSYQKFFQCPRYNNFVLWKHILSPRSFLSRLHL